MKKITILISILLSIIFITGCSKNKDVIENTNEEKSQNLQSNENIDSVDTVYEEGDVNDIIEKYKIKTPTKWGEDVTGVVNKIDTEDKLISLTFDACGGVNGSGYDKELIDYLVANEIPSTLFINHRWIEENKEIFIQLSKNKLFEIENHGYEHRPLSVNNNSIYGIEGTNSVQGAIDEIKLNEKAIYELTGKKTKYFRSGTAYYDEVAIQIADELGYKVIGFSVNGDAGATLSAKQVETSVGKSKSGDIVICHFNQPQKSTYEGLKDVLIKLKKEGYKFVKLEDVDSALYKNK